MTRTTRRLLGWKLAEWFEIELLYDAQDPDLSLRTMRPAEFVSKQPSERYCGRRPARDFILEYRGRLPRKELESIFERTLGKNSVREYAEAAALATERMINKLHPLSDKELGECDYEVPRNAISKCYPFNKVTFYTRVLPCEKTFRVDVVRSEGEGFVSFGTGCSHLYIHRRK